MRERRGRQYYAEAYQRSLANLALIAKRNCELELSSPESGPDRIFRTNAELAKFWEEVERRAAARAVSPGEWVWKKKK